MLNHDENTLFVNVTRANAVWRLPLLPSGDTTKVGLFLQLSGGGGPDGLAIDDEQNLAVAHSGFGTVWLFSYIGEPLCRIKSCAGLGTTNLAYGGADGKTLYITESTSGLILKAEMPVAGRAMLRILNRPVRVAQRYFRYMKNRAAGKCVRASGNALSYTAMTAGSPAIASLGSVTACTSAAL